MFYRRDRILTYQVRGPCFGHVKHETRRPLVGWHYTELQGMVTHTHTQHSLHKHHTHTPSPMYSSLGTNNPFVKRVQFMCVKVLTALKPLQETVV